MQSQSFPSFHVDTTPPASNSPFKIVALYDSVISLMQARNIRCRLATEFRDDVKVESNFWFHVLLTHPPLRQQAAAEAARADMIIISVSNATALTPHLMDWLEQWLPARNGQPGALVALLDHRQGMEGAPALLAYLRQRAKDFKLDFFARTDRPEPKPQLVLPVAARNGIRGNGTATSLLDLIASESLMAPSPATRS